MSGQKSFQKLHNLTHVRRWREIQDVVQNRIYVSWIVRGGRGEEKRGGRGEERGEERGKVTN